MDEAKFMVFYSSSGFRKRLSEHFRDRLDALSKNFTHAEKKDLPLEDYAKAQIYDLTDVEKPYVHSAEEPSGSQKGNRKKSFRRRESFSESTWEKFLKGEEIGFKKVFGILERFEPVLSAMDILEPLLVPQLLDVRKNHDVAEAWDDRSALDFIALDKIRRRQFKAVGAAIQVRELGEAGEFGKPRKQGLSPDKLFIEDTGATFKNFDETLIDRVLWAEWKRKDKENGEKLALTKIDPPMPNMLDEGHAVTLSIHNTDFYTIGTCAPNIFNDEEIGGRIINDRALIRRELGSLNPDENRVPNSLCLHYILCFHGGEFFAIHRHDGVMYDKRRVSVSGEEQLKPEDLNKGLYGAAWNIAYRALLEEVFPRAGIPVDDRDAKIAIDAVDYVRYLSLFYEERYCNFSLCAFIKLTMTKEKYHETFVNSLERTRILRNDQKFLHDWEGNRFWFTLDNVRDFFKTGKLSLIPFEIDDVDPIVAVAKNPDESANEWLLHSSSLYRLSKIAEVFDL